MAIIYSYALDTEILGTDILVGTCTVLVGGQSRNQTKSFSVSGLNTYMSINNPLLTTKGDLYTRSTVNARLGVGTNGQLLSADSTQTTGLKWINAPATSPLTTKGDIYTYSTTNAKLSVGTTGQILSADPTQATGLRWINNSGGGGSGTVTSVAALTIGTSGTNITSTVTNPTTTPVITLNVPDASSTARGVITIGAQDINGTKSFLTDIVVNGVNIGAGPGNDASNVRIGQAAGASLVGVQNNILIGNQAGSGQSKSGSTVIGGRVTPANDIFNQDNTLSIGKRTDVPLEVDGPLPHIWSPDFVTIDYSSTEDILVVSQSLYSAIFIDYVISDRDISLRAGTIKAVWNNAGIIKWTEESTDSIGDMSDYVFSVIYEDASSTIKVKLTNPFGAERLYCNFTSRLLTKPKLA
tara:strand:+ start:687 stop:1919 length:1233 start_codon:yes stop_codon:yes gene_type:complete